MMMIERLLFYHWDSTESLGVETDDYSVNCEHHHECFFVSNDFFTVRRNIFDLLDAFSFFPEKVHKEQRKIIFEA